MTRVEYMLRSFIHLKGSITMGLGKASCKVTADYSSSWP